MLPGMELMDCQNLAVPRDVMHHVIKVESSYNPYAIGVVGGRLQRQPKTLSEALATARMLESRGFNFSLGLAQVNRHNLAKYGLASYEHAFQACPNVVAGSRILAECHSRSGHDWGKSFSCYYSGNFVTGYRHGYVQKVYASMRRSTHAGGAIVVQTSGSRRMDTSPTLSGSVSPTSASNAPAVPIRTSIVAPRSIPSLSLGTTNLLPATATFDAREPDASQPEAVKLTTAMVEQTLPSKQAEQIQASSADSAFVF